MTARIAAAWPRCSGSRWMTELPATLSKVSRGGPSSCLGGGPISWPSSQRHHTLSLLPGFTSVGFRSPLRVGCHCLATSGKRSPNDCPGVGVFDTIWAILRCRPTFPTSQPGHRAATAPKHRSADHTCSLLIFRYPSSRSTGPIEARGSDALVRPSFVRDVDAPAWGANRGNRGVAGARVGGFHDGDLRAQPGRRVEVSGEQFWSSCDNS